MSWLGDLGENLRKIILLEDKIDRLLQDVASVNQTVLDHEKRLIRIETMIEMAGVQAGGSGMIEGD